ncbi:hypothetical protein LZC95_36250 [Pendulispora brunnea]|uniref:Uncharacterized protein n=1 Tax=Pendulispora brunnea TaxID=2905690 RepID=A0ABZ2JZI2_9BACT
MDAEAPVPVPVPVPVSPPDAAPAPATTTAPPPPPADAGANACRLLSGPTQQPFTGPAALIATDTGVDIVWHKNGSPRVISVPAVPITAAAKPARKAFDGQPDRASRPACAAAGPFAFCSDAQGQVHRALRAQLEAPDTIVAQADMGAVVTAGMLGDQPVLGYLAARTTSEGRTSEAFARLGEQPPVRISESGSGATDVVFAPRGRDTILAMTIDARRAMSPVHARNLSASPTKSLVLGTDAVIYVGGGSEHQVHGALGVDTGANAFGLMPTSAESGFGLALIRIDAPPRLDEPAHVSLYPNGFDFAAVAATANTSRAEGSSIVVARVRPIAAEPSAMRMLELGKIDLKDGSFLPFGFVPSGSSVQNVAIVRDRFGAIWVEYTDGGGSWLERRVCP